MATKTIPTIPVADVESHNSSTSCYVRIGTKVYDITPFLEDHPGGADLVLEYGGKDVQAMMQDEVSHAHSDSAYEILEEHFVGYVAPEAVVDAVVNSDHPDEIVPLPATGAGAADLQKQGISNSVLTMPTYAATGLSSAEDLSKETDTTADYKTHKFLDLDRPLLMQIWNGGFSKDFYLEQVHRPRHYKGGQSAPLFGNFLEPLSKTAWWVVPTVWLPPVLYGTVQSGLGLGSFPQLAAYWLLGLCIWTFVEYGLHRCLFHVDKYVLRNVYLSTQLTLVLVISLTIVSS